MESLLVLVGLIVLAIPVSIIVLMVGQSRLRKRVMQLERQIKVLSADAEGPLPDQPPKPAPIPKAVEDRPKPAPWSAPKPEDTPQPQPEPLQTPPEPTGAIVFREDRLSALGAWLRENWFYAVSAVSLALAGVFLVQYGAENGLLPPSARVLAALGFGIVLIAAGEVVRRRFGDHEASATAYLPSVFSGAGLVTLFGGVLAARQLYDLIGPEAALAGMITIALVGLVLGWFHGPLLAAVGLIGAFAAPFLVGGSSQDPSWLYGYFFVIAVLGLGIDTVRRWAWISVLTLIGAYVVALLLVLSSPLTEPAYLTFATALALIAIAIPARRLWPDHEGPMVLELVRRRKGSPWPEFPTRLAFGSVLTSSVILSLHWADSSGEFWLTIALFTVLPLALILWAMDARALQDVAIFPAVGLLWSVFSHGVARGTVWRTFTDTYAETAEADYPMVVTVLVALGALVTLLAAWRSNRGGGYAAVWAGAAAVFAPAMAIALEIGWQPAQVIGAYPWALHAIALGALMVVLAERFARVDGDNRMRPALATLSALSCLAFACVIVLSSAALTIALVVTVVIAAALDRKFTLPPMSWFIWAGVLTVTVRLVLNPGLDWANTAPVGEMTLVYGAAVAGFLTAWILLRPLTRPLALLLLESAAWATGGILLSLLLLRWLEGFGDGGAYSSHWGLGLLAVIWLLLAYAQVQRFALGGKLNYIRYLLAAFFAAHGLFRLAESLAEQNPLANQFSDPVLGPPIVNTLAVAYLLPALAIGFSAWRIRAVPLWLDRASYGLAGALAAVWLGLTIRHFWQGAAGMYWENGVTQPELYTYTMTLLLIGAVLFYQSLARGSDLMRKAGLAVIGLAVAKVFLIDIAGLGGLIRVFSLLALGLGLAGLAWLNRWAKLRHSPQDPEPLDH
ncbi:DUF2339 domain-containing protein [Ruegeria sp.]|uniref:DUF2339 domain-containing protein n=1 Tax=Ruegeria sp. TaxID=1879320 RepID=UPI002315D5C3|nr:DUF2339 domain-containing protein [Ruegeria sp.]MDA7966568.1 DUF2339 domain-containing protein [Ruegeria sp.]